MSEAQQEEGSGVEDAEILFPDETLELSGEQVTVREYRYLEGLRASVVARPILAGLRELIEACEGREIDPEALDELIGEHAEAWVGLIALATGRDPQWIKSLSDGDGLNLSLAFWRVNGPFFTRRLVIAGALRQGLRGLSRSPRSSTSSSGPATDETPPTSPGG
jgi:hypothetical protein